MRLTCRPAPPIRRLFGRLGVVAAPLALGACGIADYPSLQTPAAPQPAAIPSPATPSPGRITGSAVPVVATPGAMPSAAADPAALLASGTAAYGAFVARRAAAEALVAAAAHAAPGSEAWAVATVALGALTDSHGQTAAALAGLERLYTDDQLARADGDATPEADAHTAAIDDARAQVQAMMDDESVVLDRLGESL